jgi:hypothetical protein
MAAQPGTGGSDELRDLLGEAHVALAARDAEIDQLLRERAAMVAELGSMRATKVWKLASRWWEWRASRRPA